jgi:hypothetical protein
MNKSNETPLSEEDLKKKFKPELINLIRPYMYKKEENIKKEEDLKPVPVIAPVPAQNNEYSITDFTKASLKNKTTEELLEMCERLIKDDKLKDDEFKNQLANILENPQKYSDNKIINILNKDNFKRFVNYGKDTEETPALNPKEVEGTGFMKSNLSILNKFKYR